MKKIGPEQTAWEAKMEPLHRAVAQHGGDNAWITGGVALQLKRNPLLRWHHRNFNVVIPSDSGKCTSEQFSEKAKNICNTLGGQLKEIRFADGDDNKRDEDRFWSIVRSKATCTLSDKLAVNEAKQARHQARVAYPPFYRSRHPLDMPQAQFRDTPVGLPGEGYTTLFYQKERNKEHIDVVESQVRDMMKERAAAARACTGEWAAAEVPTRITMMHTKGDIRKYIDRAAMPGCIAYNSSNQNLWVMPIDFSSKMTKNWWPIVYKSRDWKKIIPPAIKKTYDLRGFIFSSTLEEKY